MNDHHIEPRPASVARRTVLQVGSALGAAAALGATAGSADANAGSSMPLRERTMVLRLAGTLSSIPARFPNFGEPEPLLDRVTEGRLSAAGAKMRAGRMAEARTGARMLIDAGLLDVPSRELAMGVGRLITHSGRTASPELRAVVALAVATVSTNFDPNADNAAELWLDVVRRLYLQTQKPATDGQPPGGGR